MLYYVFEFWFFDDVDGLFYIVGYRGEAFEFLCAEYLTKIPHIKLMRGVFIVKKENAEKFVSLLKRYRIEYHTREVILTPQDLEKLEPG